MKNIAQGLAITMFMAAVLTAPRPVAAEEGGLSPKGQKHLVELGIFAGVYIPSSQHELYDYPEVRQIELSDAAFDIGGRLAYLPVSFFGLEAELAFMPTSTATDKNALVWAARGHLLAQYPARLAPFLVIGGGAIGISSDADAQGNDVDAIFHWGLGAKYYASRRLLLRLDARHMIGAQRRGGAIRAHHFEVLAGLSFIIGWHTEEKPKDSDGDGMTDDQDKCPNEPADTPDGCPVRDRDGDGVLDDKDKCPDEPAKTPDGCPVRDRDGDGILDDKDKCVNEAENKNGYEDDDGCPDVIPQQVKRFTGSIKGIKFAFGKATIRRQSYKILDAAVKVLQEYDQLKLVIRGHTDSRGKRERNMELSRQRADSVKQYLVGKGIADDRLRTEGLGPDEPVADNKTSKGRAQNRRIEFKLDTQ